MPSVSNAPTFSGSVGSYGRWGSSRTQSSETRRLIGTLGENMEGPVSAWLPWVSVPVSGDARATCDLVSRKRNRRQETGHPVPLTNCSRIEGVNS